MTRLRGCYCDFTVIKIKSEKDEVGNDEDEAVVCRGGGGASVIMQGVDCVIVWSGCRLDVLNQINRHGSSRPATFASTAAACRLSL